MTDFIILGSKITVDGDCSHEIKRHLLLGRKSMTNLDSVLKSRDITLLTKVHVVQSYGFSSSHVQMWELDHKQGWASKKWCFQTVLEKTLESPLDSKEIKPVNSILKDIYPKYSLKKQAEAEAPILWPHDAKSWLTGKYDAGKDWRQKEKKAAEDEMVSRQHHWLNGYESEETLGDSEGQRSLMCYSLWGHKELDVT